MIIDSIRLGFANNSSSTHSILLNCRNSESFTLGDSFGWQDFLLKSKENKALYLAAQVYANLPDSISPEYKRFITKELLSVPPNLSAYPDYGYKDGAYPEIDHQSIMSLPWTFDKKELHKQFIVDFHEYLMREDISIAGGSDNSYGTVFDCESSVLGNIETDNQRRHFVARKDGDWYTLFNTSTGAKIRLSFKDDPNPYLYSSTPELVDIKITNFCPHECSYCYQSSSKDGKHFNVNKMWDITKELQKAQVFEVAIGGGEPTLHPQFASILKDFQYANIVPNFTSKNMDWANNKKIKDAVIENAGSFAISVNSYGCDTVEEVKKWNQEMDSLISLDHTRSRPYGTVQIPMGAYNLSFVKEVIKQCEFQFVPFTLLGYKKFGRGLKFKPQDYSGIMGLLAEVNCNRFGADTIFVEEFKEQLKKFGADESMFVGGEGKFSCYIDAVEKEVGKSSYCGKMKKFDKYEGVFNEFPYLPKRLKGDAKKSDREQAFQER